MSKNGQKPDFSLSIDNTCNEESLLIENLTKANDINQVSNIQSEYLPNNTEEPKGYRNDLLPGHKDKIINQKAETRQSYYTILNNSLRDNCSKLERGYCIINIIIIKSCIVLVIHYCYLIYYTGLFGNIYNYLGLILLPSLAFFPSQFISFIIRGEKKKIIYCITVSIILFIMAVANYVITLYPSVIGHQLYHYLLTQTNKTKIYCGLIMLQGSGVILAMILSSIYSDEEPPSIKVPLLE